MRFKICTKLVFFLVKPKEIRKICVILGTNQNEYGPYYHLYYRGEKGNSTTI